MFGIKEVGLVFLWLCGMSIMFFIQNKEHEYRQKRANACPNAYVADKHNAPQYASLVVKKYRDRPNHNEKCIEIKDSNNNIIKIYVSHGIDHNDPFDTRFWEYVEEGDSLAKPSNSLETTIFKKDGQKRTFKADCL